MTIIKRDTLKGDMEIYSFCDALSPKKRKKILKDFFNTSTVSLIF